MKLRRIFDSFRMATYGATAGGDLSVSWTPPAPEREELRKLVVFLEDRRALFDPYNVEAPILVEQSLQEIRGELTRVLQALDEDSRAAEQLRTMRDACQRYLTRTRWLSGVSGGRGPARLFGDLSNDEGDDFVLALGELRGAFMVCVGQIASTYDIEVQGKLGRLVPQRDRPA
jgi:hypothetical protein